MNTELIAWLCSGAVGAVFVFAGVSKLALGPSWLVQARDLGVPRTAIPLVRFIPWLEIAIGLGLIAEIFEAIMIIVAIAMLIGFTTLIVRQLLQGHRPPCACFGRRSIRPIGWSNVTRNLVLIGLLVAAARV